MIYVVGGDVNHCMESLWRRMDLVKVLEEHIAAGSHVYYGDSCGAMVAGYRVDMSLDADRSTLHGHGFFGLQLVGDVSFVPHLDKERLINANEIKHMNSEDQRAYIKFLIETRKASDLHGLQGMGRYVALPDGSACVCLGRNNMNAHWWQRGASATLPRRHFVCFIMYTDVSKLYERRELIDEYEGVLNKFLRSEEWVVDATHHPPLPLYASRYRVDYERHEDVARPGRDRDQPRSKWSSSPY